LHLPLDPLELGLRLVQGFLRRHHRLVRGALLVRGSRLAQLLLGVAHLLLRIADLLLRLPQLLLCFAYLLLSFARRLLRLLRRFACGLLRALARLPRRLVDGFPDRLPDVLILLRRRCSARDGDERDVMGRHGDAPEGLAT
jgi:hypothetical protein